MPVTIEVNKMSVSHKGSIGISTSFPDVCKTPAPPAPPIPIPYPNVAQSSDTSDGSSTVKFDGNMIMIKGANMMMSTGDEAGAALGVVSNKIKGKAEFVNYSFDVKVDGGNVCRLADPTQQNMGSANAAAFFHGQAPVAVTEPQLEGCEKVDKKQKQQNVDEKTAWKKSGIYSGHHGPIQQVADELGVILYFRATNHWCADNGWIPGKHKPKPHEVLEAKTISEANVKQVQKWMKKPDFESEIERSVHGAKYSGWAAPPVLPHRAEALFGVVMSLESHNLGEPLRGYGWDSNEYSYVGKWITGDYDLQDIMFVGGDCRRPDQDAEAEFGRVKRALNEGMGWDGIQHGPQAQWKEKTEHADVDMPKALDAWVKAPANTPVQQVQITEKRQLPVCDKGLTVVAPGKAIFLETEEDVKNALICCGCGNK
jgi:hypothetical protein